MRSFLIAALAALALTMTAARAAETPTTIEMQVDGLVCAFCAQGIEKKLRAQGATADVFVSLEHKLVAVALKPQQDISDDALKTLLTDAGYSLRGVKRTREPLADLRARTEAP
jgi:copper chaperone CopZ